jgi:hypothetical protein
MPFGTKPDPGRPDIDFNSVYEKGIKPAIEAAGMEPIRADKEQEAGIIHKLMFERLLFCEFAIADLTTANANVFYELGVRHAARPRTTVSIYAKHHRIPFDLQSVRALPYDLGPDNRFDDDEAGALCAELTTRLRAVRKKLVDVASVDSPVFELLREWEPSDLSHLKTDVFRENVRINEDCRTQMRSAVSSGAEEGIPALRVVQERLGELDAEETGLVIQLLLSYRALEAWSEMIELYERMPVTLKSQILVREQTAFALNRRAGETNSKPDRDDALRMLTGVEEQQGPSAETCGLLGRIYKDLWDENRVADPLIASGYLDKAIQAYKRGFDADPRDAFPGINFLTLLEMKGDAPSKELRDRYLPVVRFAVQMRIDGGNPDYWDHATMLELAVLDSDPDESMRCLIAAAPAIRAKWEPKTTARNLSLLQDLRSKRGEDTSWLGHIIAELMKRAV